MSDPTNPKDLIGVTKVPMTNVPAIAVALEAEAFADGNDKYGPFNWRLNAVRARIYIDAALRHIAHWFEGEERAPDSGAHHLGHARACLAIILDAQTTGNLVDDRPTASSERFESVFSEINARTKARTDFKPIDWGHAATPTICTRAEDHEGPCDGLPRQSCLHHHDVARMEAEGGPAN